MRRAKRIAHAILVKAHATALGGAKVSDDEGKDVIYFTSRIVARDGRRAPGAGGVRDEHPRAEKSELLNCVRKVADKFEQMADAVSGGNRTFLEQFVRDEMTRALEPTLKSIDYMKSMLSQVMNS